MHGANGETAAQPDTPASNLENREPEPLVLVVALGCQPVPVNREDFLQVGRARELFARLGAFDDDVGHAGTA